MGDVIPAPPPPPRPPDRPPRSGVGWQSPRPTVASLLFFNREQGGPESHLSSLGMLLSRLSHREIPGTRCLQPPYRHDQSAHRPVWWSRLLRSALPRSGLSTLATRQDHSPCRDRSPPTGPHRHRPVSRTLADSSGCWPGPPLRSRSQSRWAGTSSPATQAGLPPRPCLLLGAADRGEPLQKTCSMFFFVFLSSGSPRG